MSPISFDINRERIKKYIAYPLLMLTVLFWSGNIVVGKALYNDITPLGLSFWRWLLASLVLLPFALSHLRRDWMKIVHAWRIIITLSFLGISAFNMLLYYSAHTTSANNIALIQTSMPVYVVALSFILFRHRVTVSMLAGIVLAIAGAVFVIFKGEWSSMLQVHFYTGDISMLVAVFIYSLYSVLLPKAPDIHPLSLLAISFIVGTLILLPLYSWEVVTHQPVVLNAKLVILISYTAVFPSILAYLFWNYGVKTLGSSTTGLFSCFIPVFTPIISFLFLNETLQLYHGAGMLLIIIGVLVVHFSKERNSISASENS